MTRSAYLSQKTRITEWLNSMMNSSKNSPIWAPQLSKINFKRKYQKLSNI
jgi:hypothetical protein